MDGYDVRLATLEIGLAGCHGQCANERASVSIYDRRLSAYFGELVEGGFVIDKAAVLDAKPGLAVMAPLCRGDLPAGRRNVFRERVDPAMAAALSQPESFGGVALLMAAAPDCGAFDDVSPDVFAAWWAAHGARIGVRRGDRIEWADGTSEAIRPAAERWAC
jgi:hypothetical protein